MAGFASTIFMPIEAWLLTRVGWRMALTILAVVLAVITIPIHAFVLRTLLLLGLGTYPSVLWTLAGSMVLASLAVVIAGAGVTSE